MKILHQMSDYLQVRNLNGKNVYYLSQKGRELIGAEQEVKWSLQVEHHLLRNDMYLHYGCPVDWEVEMKITFKHTEGLQHKEMTIVPDATFTKKGIYHFVEIDRTQSMFENKKKIETYVSLSPAIQAQYTHTPIIVFYTLTPFRQTKLRALCQEHNLPCEVYTKEDIR
jgi:hypothetical protein